MLYTIIFRRICLVFGSFPFCLFCATIVHTSLNDRQVTSQYPEIVYTATLRLPTFTRSLPQPWHFYCTSDDQCTNIPRRINTFKPGCVRKNTYGGELIMLSSVEQLAEV